MFEPTTAQISAAIGAIHDHAIVPRDAAQRHRLLSALAVLDAMRGSEDRNENE